MFSTWFSGGAREAYRASPHKQRIDRVGRSLLKKRYLDEVTRRHLHEWLRFVHYLAARDISCLKDVGGETVRRYSAKRTVGRSASLQRFVRASVRVFLESDEAGQFRRRVGTSRLTAPSWFKGTLRSYLEFAQRHRGLAPSTLKKYARQLAVFTQFLEQKGIRQIALIRPCHVQEFYENASSGRPRDSYNSTLRAFFRWAAMKGWIVIALSDAIPRPRRYRLASLPEVLTEAELSRVLAAVDRSTTVGRRDYAVLLLAARYGLRPCDIRQLTIDHIDWRAARIDLQQAKTGKSLALPLLPDVEEALGAYLRGGRPASASRVVFIRHRAPFEPFVPENNLSTIMGGALRRAGLADRPGRRGLYLLRHTLATRLLATGRPLKTIADVMGHASTETTYGYTRVDLVRLRTVAISEAEVSR